MDLRQKNRIAIKEKTFHFFRETPQKKENLSLLSSFDSCSRFIASYSILSEVDFRETVEVKNCAALILSKEILGKLNSLEIAADDRCGLSEDFYSQIAENLQENEKLPQDRELLIINLKQTAELLRNSGLIVSRNGKVKPQREEISRAKLLGKMMNSFWNNTNWGDIFPSSPELAEKIYQFKTVIQDLLAENPFGTKTEILASDFLEITGIAPSDDSFSLSFFEFYIVNWLNNFGIISLTKQDSGDSFQIEDHGMKLLSSFI